MKKAAVLTAFFFWALAGNSIAVEDKGCFFKSDCPADYACVTAKGAARGVCQLQTVAEKNDTSGLGKDSIIKDVGKCTFNTDCPDGGQCVKPPGALHGVCQGSGYTPENILADRGPLYKNNSCYFDQDCKTGQACVKSQGSFKGMCQDDFYNTDADDRNDPRALLKNQQQRTSNKKCLASTDCGLREACVQQERSVFGVCTPNSAISATTTTPATTTTDTSTNPFGSNSLFSK